MNSRKFQITNRLGDWRVMSARARFEHARNSMDFAEIMAVTNGWTAMLSAIHFAANLAKHAAEKEIRGEV